jgi:tetratricopeptide (TPR) repeat protein
MSFDMKELEKSLSERVKTLNLKGKFEEANALLDKMKKIPLKLIESYKNAEDAIKKQDYEKAEREFEEAKRFAEELDEKDLAKMLKSRAQMSRKIPDFLKKREDYLNRAMQGLRSDKFEEAQKNFQLASDVSKELMDSRRAEEYGLKAKALAEYVKIDRKFR